MFDRFRPMPKKLRPKKARKPLKRGKAPVRKKRLRPFASGSRKSPLDPSDFRDADVMAVHGPTPICFQTARPASPDHPLERHHIFGRGGKDPGDREIHSSIFNCALIPPEVHRGPMRDLPAQREAYLDVAIGRVMRAVGRGAYTLADTDRAFLERYRPGIIDR